MPHYWLMKSEPGEVSVDDALAAPNATVPWTGVRNYQARNYMRDAMRVGDGVLFYHSSCAEPGIVGIARVASGAYTDPTQFEADSPYFDAASKPESPRWLLVDVQVLRKTRNLTLTELRGAPELADLLVLKKGNRLSITPVEPQHWQAIMQRVHGS
jgi:predicted RNA-binding protein with PUA-like domain